MDWNEDGLKDLLVGEQSGNVRYYRNVGTPGSPFLTFEGLLMAGGYPIEVDQHSFPWIDDWNEDGLKDLLVGSIDGRFWLFINVGTNSDPVFNTSEYLTLANGFEIDLGSRSAPVVTDLNGDGLKDIASGNIDGCVFFFENYGTNADPLLAAPDTLKMGTIMINPGPTTRATPIDWNADGLMDLVVGSNRARLKRYPQEAFTPPAPAVDLVMTSPFIIPAGGGTLEFTFEIVNENAAAVSFDVWAEVKLPSNTFWGPLFVRPDVSLGPFSTISRNLSQIVPGTAPGGYYYFYGYAGDYSTLQIYSEEYFYLNKSATDGDPPPGGWTCTGWENNDFKRTAPYTRDVLHLSAAPNPFNPITTISFSLPEASKINLSIYDLSGRLVMELINGWRTADTHEVTFNGSALSSSIYIYRLTAGHYTASGKMVLMK